MVKRLIILLCVLVLTAVLATNMIAATGQTAVSQTTQLVGDDPYPVPTPRPTPTNVPGDPYDPTNELYLPIIFRGDS